MSEQAEDVMGSLLKEYLKVTKKEGEILSDTNGSDGILSDSKKSEETLGASEKGEETLGASEKSEKIPNASQNSEETLISSGKSDEFPATGEINTSMDDIEQEPVVDHVPENNANEVETSEVAAIEENGSQLNCCNPKSETNLTRQFKNIVAIVDPPRGGLHPIVSILSFLNYKWNLFLFFSVTLFCCF